MHNHPSGTLNPSKHDTMFTDQISKVCQMVGIPLLDHIVIGDNRYISLRESGYLS